MVVSIALAILLILSLFLTTLALQAWVVKMIDDAISMSIMACVTWFVTITIGIGVLNG